MLVTTLIRKLLRLKAHKVIQVELQESRMLVTIDQLGERLLQCGVCGQRCRKVHGRPRAERSWRDLSLRDQKMILRYRPRRVNCPRCSAGGTVSLGRILGAGDPRFGPGRGRAGPAD